MRRLFRATLAAVAFGASVGIADAATLTLTGAAYDTTAPKFGTADLSAGYGSTGAITSTATGWTIEAWVKQTAAQASSLQIAASIGSAYIGTSSGYAIGNPGGGYVSGAPLIDDGAWHHLAISCVSGTGTFLVDGVSYGAQSCSALNNPTLYVGSIVGTSTYAWAGNIDQVALFGAARYQGSFTPSASAYSGTEPALLGLFGLNGNATDGTQSPATPAVLVATPAAMRTGSTATIAGSYAVASGTPTFTYAVDGGSPVAVTPTLSGGGYTFPIAGPSNGSHTIAVAMTSGGSSVSATSAAFQAVNGTPLAMSSGATYTSSAKFGSGALSGGYGSATIALGSSWTMEQWVRNTSACALQISFASGSVANVPYMGEDGNCYAYASLGKGLSVSTTIKLNDGNWHHLALVDTAGTVAFYVDGNQMGSGAGSTGATPLVLVGELIGAGNFVWGGQIDQAAVWNYPRYSGSSIPLATAPYTGAEPGLLNLWSFDGQNGNDTATAGGGSAPALSIATPANGTPTASSVTLSGTYNGTAPTGVSVATDGTTFSALTGFSAANGLWSGTWSVPAAPASTVLTAQEAGVSSASAVSGSFTTAGVQSFAPNNPAIYYSPMNWTPATASVASTINAGAYFKTVFSGTGCTLLFDVSNMGSPASQIWWRVDGSSGTGWVKATVASSVPCPVPAITATQATHTLDVVIKATTQQNNRWNAPSATAVNFLGLTLYKGGSLQAPAIAGRTIVFFGDSITEGVRTVSLVSANDVDQNDALTTWDWLVGSQSGAEFGIVGFGSSGLQQPGSGNVPVWGSTWNYVMGGVPRSFASCPTAFVVNEGTNDATKDAGTEQTLFKQMLSNLSGACPASRILVLIPFNGAQSAAISAAVTTSGNPMVNLIGTTGFFSASNGSVDGLHPSAANDTGFIGPAVQAAIAPILAQASRSYSFR